MPDHPWRPEEVRQPGQGLNEQLEISYHDWSLISMGQQPGAAAQRHQDVPAQQPDQETLPPRGARDFLLEVTRRRRPSLEGQWEVHRASLQWARTYYAATPQG